MDASLTAGRRVTWLHEPRGGYGYVIRVPAVVLKVGPKRVTIAATLEGGGTKTVAVRPEKLELA